MVSEWFPLAERLPAGDAGVMGGSGARKVVVHTEGVRRATPDAHGLATYVRDQNIAYHLTYDGRRFVQLYPMGVASRALKAGDWSPNRDGAACFQICLAGVSDAADIADWPMHGWAEFLGWLREHRIPARTSADWVRPKRSVSVWRESGWVGHCHAPFNDHMDGQGAPLRVLLGREWRVAGVTRFGNARLVGRVGSGFRWAGPGVTRGLRMSRDEADGGRRWAEAHRASDVRVTRSRFPLLRLADGARWPSDDDLLRRLHEAARRRGRVVEIRSGQRTVEEQRVLWEAWVAFRDHGGPPANRAAPPDADAPHVRGVAADCGVILTSGYRSVGDDPGMRRELRASGLCLPVGGEPWHVQVGSEWEG